MVPIRSAQEYIAALCYGTLYERLAAAAAVPEAAASAATEWNNLARILQTLAGHDLTSIETPQLEASGMQRRILAEYIRHPMLRRGESLAELLERTSGVSDIALLIDPAVPEDALHQARYIDHVRQELGELTLYSPAA